MYSQKNSSHLRRVTALAVVLAILLQITLLCLASSAAPSGDASGRKIRISSASVAADVSARGGKLIADYGTFQVFRLDASLANSLDDKVVDSLADDDRILLNTGTLDTTTEQVKGLRKAVVPNGGKRLHLVQFAGPIKPEWRDALENTGVEIITYIPNNAYLIYGHGQALAQMQAWAESASYVQWEGSYADDYKIHPRARVTDAKGNPQKTETDLFAIQLMADPAANPASLAMIDHLKLEPIEKQSSVLNYVNVLVRIPPGLLPMLAAQPEVVSIQPYPRRQKMDERQDQILANNLSGPVPSGPGYLAWLASKGFTQAQFAASGFAVDVSDSGIDNGTTAPGHFGLYLTGDSSLSSRVIYNRLVGTPNSGSTLQGCDGHGTLNTHIIAGYNDLAAGFPHTDSTGFHYGLGVCPFVRVGSSVIFDSDTFTSPNYTTLQSQAYHDGARVSNNSWGANTAGAYDVDSQTYDALVRDAQPTGATFSAPGNQEMVIVFAAGNAGSAAQTVGAPGTAKNVITVGAAESVRSLSTANGGNDASGNDGCSLPDSSADSANDIASFSSRGPCSDGRKKPEIVAPGTHISGGVAQNSPAPSPTGTGSAIACFKATGVCGLAGGGTVNNGNDFFPLNQQFYSTSSGTSHSTPAVVGCCALLRQYFINQGFAPPSPAMTKAYLMNSARYLNGVGANDSLWSNNQGMGEVNLDNAFDAATRVLRDEDPVDKFTATGQTRTYTGTVVDSSKPFRLTLAWTDAPGNTSGNAYNNNLDLTVTVSGNTYKGNVFSGQYSTSGGTADSQNNAESVFLPAGTTGSFTVTVTAANINSDGVPNEAPALDQDFALVIYNGAQVAAPVIAPGTASLSAETCSPANGAPDPGETVTYSFSLQNIGTANATNVVATLLVTNGVAAPTGAQSYGALGTGAVAVARSFTFTANGSCGNTIVPTLQLQDGAKALGTVSFPLNVGVLATLWGESFDSVNAPALPGGWVTSATGGQSSWTNSTGASDSPPNAMFAPEATTPGLAELDSPVIQLPTGNAQLSFRNNYNLEAATTGSTGYDGGVLEIKIGAGGYTDIITAGGSFVTGGYTRTISTGYSNPLGGRQAWSGSSGGFITTTINLPASASGQIIQLRWLCGTDTDTAKTGWYVDTVIITAPSCCGQLIAPGAAFSGAPLTGIAPLTVSFTDSSTGTITNRSWNFGNGAVTNTTATTVTAVYSNAGSYNVSLLVSGAAGTNLLARTGYVVVTNAVSLISTNGFALFAELCTNGAVDPGEPVTVSLGLRNNGGLTTSNLVATLVPSANVSSPSSAQAYGALASGATVSRSFSFVAFGTCGSAASATLQLQDGAIILGTVSFNFVLGQAAPLSQNFDSTSVPALPTGWSSSASGAQANWVTTNGLSDTGTNGAFSPDSAAVGINELDTPSFVVPASAQLSFRHNYNLESASSGTTGYDGGVLEIKIAAGSFTDILSAGGSFVSGGYTKTISSTYSNPLAGRQAWSGNSGGFITTVVNFPAAAVGQNVQLRWRCGTDTSVAQTGWYIDTVQVGGISCCSSAPVITMQPQGTASITGQNVTFNVGATGTAPLAYQWLFKGSPISGATGSGFSRSPFQQSDSGVYTVLITNIAGAITSAPAMLTLVTNPVLKSPLFLSNGHFTFLVSGNTGLSYSIEASSNFSKWVVVRTVTNTTGQVPFTETNPILPFRAYRARLLP